MLQPCYSILSFDGFRLDLKRGCLFGRSGEEVKLRPKSFEVLTYLVENSGRLISKEELIGSVWAGTAVTDDSLVQCLINVRRALADSEQRLVKTVPRRGYMFQAAVLRAADDLRVSVELIEASTCKAAWSQVSRVSLGEIFELQDSLARRIVSALPLTARDRERNGARDVPRDKRAYELFLRANRYAMESNTWRLAQSLYEECLERDPPFAPAWARLGRILRVLGKYNPDGERVLAHAAAEGALKRALELNPDLSAAHLYLSQLETDLGRAEESMARLLRRARGGRAEPEILAALVHACRYCGLLDASVAAHDLAMRLDPATETSVLYSYFALGRYEQTLEAGTRSADTLDSVVLSILGRPAQARAAAVREEERFASHQVMCTFYSAMRALLENRYDDARALLARRAASHNMDGEAIYHTMRLRALLGDRAEALDLLERSIAQGYFCTPLFDGDPWLASVRGEARFVELMQQARARHERALAHFDRENGPSKLGIIRCPKIS